MSSSIVAIHIGSPDLDPNYFSLIRTTRSYKYYTKKDQMASNDEIDELMRQLNDLAMGGSKRRRTCRRTRKGRKSRKSRK